jgi:hypothetical protein
MGFRWPRLAYASMHVCRPGGFTICTLPSCVVASAVIKRQRQLNGLTSAVHNANDASSAKMVSRLRMACLYGMMRGLLKFTP